MEGRTIPRRRQTLTRIKPNHPDNHARRLRDFLRDLGHIDQPVATRYAEFERIKRPRKPEALKDIRSLADLVSYDVADMLKFRNFGKKSLTEIQDLVKSKGLSFGMNLSKFKLDEE